MPADSRRDLTRRLTLILLTWRIWWASNNASRWQIGFNSAFKGLNTSRTNSQSRMTLSFYVLRILGAFDK